MTQTYMTPATADKPGQVVALQDDEHAAQQYLSPLQATQFAVTVPHFVQHAHLTPAEREALEAERTKLTESLPRLRRHERQKAETRIRVIDAELRRNRATE